MLKECLNQWIKKNGEKIICKKGSFLFKSNQKDYNVYYIEKGLIELMQDGNKIFQVGDEELIGEKSFVENTKKPIDALIIEKSIIYKLSPDNFDKLEYIEQRKGHEYMIQVLSNRIYKMNAILNLLVCLDKSIIDFSKQNDKTILKDFIKQLMDLEGYLIVRFDRGSFMQIDGGLVFNKEIEDFVTDLIRQEIFIKIGKNYLYIRSADFVFVFQGKVNVEHYIIVNAIIYSQAILNYLGELLEKDKTQKLLDSTNMLNE